MKKTRYYIQKLLCKCIERHLKSSFIKEFPHSDDLNIVVYSFRRGIHR